MPKVQAHGINIFYEYMGQGEVPLALIGGSLFGRQNFGLVWEGLGEHFKLISYDQRGYGQTDRPLQPYTMELWADDLAAPDSPGRDEDGIAFLRDVLGARWIADKATEDGRVVASPNSPLAAVGEITFESGLGRGVSYGCEAPDALQHAMVGEGDEAEPAGEVVLRYANARFGAAVLSQPPAPGRALSFGFPLECIADEETRRHLLERSIDLLRAE